MFQSQRIGYDSCRICNEGFLQLPLICLSKAQYGQTRRGLATVSPVLITCLEFTMADTKEDKDMTATTDVAETAKTVAAEKTADKPTEKMTEKSADNAIPERLPKVLIVDDDPRLRDLLRRYLGENGFSVNVADGAQNMDRLWLRERFDALVLDLMMPGEDGLQILRRLRSAKDTTPILMLTARGDPVDRILGLELGADDYLGKPFAFTELLARKNEEDLYQLSFTYDDMAIVKKMKEIVPEYKSQHSKYSELDAK